MKIHSYVVARDFGFAPNPFFDYCTLATCKPIIRRTAQVGDIVIGTRASPKDYELVFFLEISEICTFEQYWQDPRFIEKKPNFSASIKHAFGDNIYHKDSKQNWVQEDSHHTNYDGTPVKENIDKDTSGLNVLIAKNFSYWGRESIPIPEDLRLIKKIGPGHKSDFNNLQKLKIIEWLKTLPSGVQGLPIDWGV
ncbi:hypothetical protein GTP55_21255 [Duganella sp. FT109W]|uniref:Nucleotide modification associated domain-containing protein n=1 Tax=Duganella margarita TaxID=2692170 RepID=A0ABW9WNK2_9BURK|nr:hypothetical protein [Duganella margarita]MYN41890.1 hypothetical protein [Duganella margarita]